MRYSKAFLTVCFFGVALCVSPSPAAQYRVTNATDLLNDTPNLKAGDTLSVASGTYSLSSWYIQNISGTRTNWITICADSNVVIQGTAGAGDNLVNINNVHYLNFTGFEITSLAPLSATLDGIKFPSNTTDSSYITFDHLFIHGMGNNGITIMNPSVSFITLRNSEVSSNALCGLYWGYPASYVVHDVLIENNYIHDCPVDPASTTGYGIQYKGGCYRARIIDNVLHDVGGTTRCGIVVYYGKTNPQGDVPADMNIVRGNVLWNCRNEGITAMSDALIENNIVFDAKYGIHVQTYSDELGGTNYVENLVVRNNTAFRCSVAAIEIDNWGTLGSNVSFTGNAAYQTNASQTAIAGSVGTAHAAGNVRYGTGLSTGTTVGNGLSDFHNVTAAGTVSNLNFYPSASSALLNKIASASDWAPQDFNGTNRPSGAAADAGAYEYTATNNPGWTIQNAFKPIIPPQAPKVLQFSRASATNFNFCWPYTVQWTQVEFVQTLGNTNWVSLAGPLYATNATVALPANATNGFFRLRLQ